MDKIRTLRILKMIIKISPANRISRPRFYFVFSEWSKLKIYQTKGARCMLEIIFVLSVPTQNRPMRADVTKFENFQLVLSLSLRQVNSSSGWGWGSKSQSVSSRTESETDPREKSHYIVLSQDSEEMFAARIVTITFNIIFMVMEILRNWIKLKSNNLKIQHWYFI